MALRVVRESKYRHVYGEMFKKEAHFTQLRPVFEGNRHHIAANDKYFLFSGQGGGGPVYVVNVDEPGRAGANPPKIMVHKGKVVDFQFNPFNSQIVATASEDAMIKINRIPDGGLKKDTTEAVATLEGHGKKLAVINFHPTAANVLASGSFDNTVKLWDIETQQEKLNVETHTDAPYSLAFNTDGSLIGTTCKDRKMRIFDPRAMESALETDGFGGNKTSEILFIDNFGLILSTGFSKGGMRQYAIYDPKKFDKPVKTEDIDASPGVMCTYYDPDLNLVYMAGKGDGDIKYFEMVREAPYCYLLGSFRDNVSQKGFTMMPKISCDVKKCEIARGMRLLGDSVQPVSFIVPRKTELFQADIFPDTYAYQPSASVEEYFSGINKAPIMRSMNPKNAAAVGAAAAAAAANQQEIKAQKSPAELQKELDAAYARIAELEKALAAAQN